MQAYDRGHLNGQLMPSLCGVIVVLWMGCSGPLLNANRVTEATFSPNGKRVAIVSASNLYIASADDLDDTDQWTQGTQPIRRVQWSPDSKTLSFWRGGEHFLATDGHIKRFGSMTNEQISEPQDYWTTFWDPNGTLNAVRSGAKRKDELYEFRPNGELQRFPGYLYHQGDRVTQVLVDYSKHMAVSSQTASQTTVNVCTWAPPRQYCIRSIWAWTAPKSRTQLVTFGEKAAGLFVMAEDVANENAVYFLDLERKTADKDITDVGPIFALEPLTGRTISVMDGVLKTDRLFN